MLANTVGWKSYSAFPVYKCPLFISGTLKKKKEKHTAWLTTLLGTPQPQLESMPPFGAYSSRSKMHGWPSSLRRSHQRDARQQKARKASMFQQGMTEIILCFLVLQVPFLYFRHSIIYIQLTVHLLIFTIFSQYNVN